jgi:hypothetical protein
MDCKCENITLLICTLYQEYSFYTLQGSVDSQLDAISLQGKKLNQERKPSLTRSQTDSNITYTGEEITEAQGSVCYITKDGDIDYQVVLKVVLHICIW